MRKLVYDFETTGLPDWNQPSDAPQQPHIVQLGAILVDDVSKKVIHGLDLIIRPVGWTISPEMTAIHGISHEYAEQVGVSEELAFRMLLEFWDCCQSRIAHNESFDARIARIGIKRYLKDEALAEAWKAGEAECTAKLSTPILNLAPTEKMVKANRTNAKTAKLTEAYQYFMGKPLENAHSAMADCIGCWEVYQAIKEGRGQATAA